MSDLVMFFIALVIVACAAIYANVKIDIEAANNGLQQCVVKESGYSPQIVWQKECK